MQCLPPSSPRPPVSAIDQLRHTAAVSAAGEEQPTLIELFGDSPADGAVTGFVLAHLHGATRPVLWIQDRLSEREAGRPALAGLTVPVQIVHVAVSRPVDALWAMEEGLGCTELAAVICEIWGDPAVLDFTATKRLALRAEAQGCPAFLVRRAASPNLSAARLRWRITSLPALADPFDSRAPGQPLWQAELFRARWRTPGQWVASHDPRAGLHFAHEVRAGLPAAPDTVVGAGPAAARA